MQHNLTDAKVTCMINSETPEIKNNKDHWLNSSHRKKVVRSLCPYKYWSEQFTSVHFISSGDAVTGDLRVRCNFNFVYTPV